MRCKTPMLFAKKSFKSWKWFVRTWKKKQTGSLPENNIQNRKGDANLCIIQMRSPETEVTLKNANVHENPKRQDVILYHMSY